MRSFACPVCRRLVPFEADHCLHSDTQLAFDWGPREMVQAGPRCRNHGVAACNGLAGAEDALCWACLLTRTRPNDDDAHGLGRFALAEGAKRRLLFTLLELGLPVESRRDCEGALAFDLLDSTYQPVTTGHADGVITIDLAEADDAHREQARIAMHEPYRTLLGHMRHEVAHYYETVLVPEGSEAYTARVALMGDPSEDYQAAIDRHYAEGPPDDWPERFVSAYATMHPFEDWAETFAHYLHIRDTLQTAASWGVRVDGPTVEVSDPAPLHADPAVVEDGIEDTMRELLDTWVPFTIAQNAINRSMGAGDLYPFVITPMVARKLNFVHQLIARR